MITVIIAKPTKDCNADCSYCSTPPDHEGGWSFEQFKVMFDRIHPQVSENATWIWHGGEPMLLGPDFYVKTAAYAKSIKPNLKFALQSNLLLYTTNKWKKVFEDVFGGEISTSYDPDAQNRTIKGSTEAYTRQFYKKMENVQRDGFRPLVIGTYTEETAHYALKMYETSKARGEQSFSLRYNYRYPAGRVKDAGPAIDPVTYGNMLNELYNKWMTDLPNFLITPLDQMFLKCFDTTTSFCPWTNSCGGKFISIDPNGDIYNCGEFGDLKNPDYRYGNLLEGWISTQKKKQIVNFHKKPSSEEKFGVEMMNTYPAKLMKRRKFDLPMSCKECRHYEECEGGCMRDAELYEQGLGGKFFYCQSWKMVFDRMKISILNGEADGIIKKMGFIPSTVRKIVRSKAINNGFFDKHPEAANITIKEV
ncbi:hypothetical protein [Psychromonas sp. SP041]|uniref:radical SAM protein n=1 Tax=Psychromonas sp. SP041 TaxID=1365007 RepID=UPI00198161AB|nr:hypothetical protein [Psychromonas sp. SP041]